MVKNIKLSLILGLLILIGFAVFVMAVDPGLITGLNYTNNATPLYDEGNFTVNWTAATGSNATAYNITIWVDDAYWTTADNDSLTGYNFNNWTDGNYTFAVAAWNSTDSDGANSTNVSVVVDRTVPAVPYSLIGMNVEKANVSQDWVSVNVSGIYDLHNATAATISYSIYNSSGLWNQTNFTDAYATITINWTGLVDGVYYYNVTVNDSATNTNVTSMRTITLDTTNPVASGSCSPSSVTSGSSVTCNCSGTDGGSGVDSSSTTAGSIIVTSGTGTFSYTCSVTDYAGNSHSNSGSYSVTGGSSSTTTTTSFWTGGTHTVSDEQFVLGFTRELSVSQRFKVQVDSSDHYVGVVELTATTATINISSDPQQIVLSIGDEGKFEVSGDDYYDILVRLNSIENNKANVTIESINELVVIEETDDDEETIATNVVDDIVDALGDNGNAVVWIVIGIIIIGVVVVAYVLIKKNKSSS